MILEITPTQVDVIGVIAQSITAVIGLFLAGYIFIYQKRRDKQADNQQEIASQRDIRLSWFRLLLIEPQLDSLRGNFDRLEDSLNGWNWAYFDTEFVKVGAIEKVKTSVQAIRKSFIESIRIVEPQLGLKLQIELDRMSDSITNILSDSDHDFGETISREKYIFPLIWECQNNFMRLLYLFAPNNADQAGSSEGNRNSMNTTIKRFFRPKRLLLGLLFLHMISYLLFAEVIMEKRVANKYLEFAERRFENQLNKDLDETIIVASCGEEYFRDLTTITETTRRSNPLHPPEEIVPFKDYSEKNFTQSLFVEPYPLHVLDVFHRSAQDRARNFIVYRACTLRSAPFFFKHVYYDHAFSDGPTDFHIMHYNEQYHTSDSYYIWFLFTWIEVHGPIVKAPY